MDSVEKKLEALKENIQVLNLEQHNLEVFLKEKDLRYKDTASVSLSTLETLIEGFRKKYTLYKDELENIYSYSGPSPDGGKSEDILKGKIEVLQEVIVNFDLLISESLKKFKENL